MLIEFVNDLFTNSIDKDLFARLLYTTGISQIINSQAAYEFHTNTFKYPRQA